MRACDASAQDTRHRSGAELDIVNMYTKIPTEHLHEAVAYGKKGVEVRTRSPQTTKGFALSRGSKSEVSPGHIL